MQTTYAAFKIASNVNARLMIIPYFLLQKLKNNALRNSSPSFFFSSECYIRIIYESEDEK